MNSVLYLEEEGSEKRRQERCPRPRRHEEPIHRRDRGASDRRQDAYHHVLLLPLGRSLWSSRECDRSRTGGRCWRGESKMEGNSRCRDSSVQNRREIDASARALLINAITDGCCRWLINTITDGSCRWPIMRCIPL